MTQPTLKTYALGLLAAATLGTTYSQAGTVASKAPESVLPAEAEPFVTGTLSFVANTHFMLYGQDVWGGGNDFFWRDAIFNPSLELNFNLGNGFKAILGTWWDVNDNAESTMGNRIQEVDVWAGLSYNTGKFTFTALYQAWFYGGGTEQMVDFKVAYEHFLNPYLLLHGRFDAGAAVDLAGLPLDEGLIVQLGIAPAVEAGPVTISFPITANWQTKGFHSGQEGFSYASGGVNISIPVHEHVAINLGATYYWTNDKVIPLNKDHSLVAGSAGITITF